MNCQLFARRRRFVRGGENGGDLSRFLLKLDQAFAGHHLGFGNHFQPELHFVGFFFGDADLRDELRFRSYLASSAIICCQGSSGARNLIRKNAPFHTARQFLRKVQHAQRELRRACLQLFCIHA